jgi:8-oxo-dGTP pyrophosphatase MutT (NUDIX family)
MWKEAIKKAGWVVRDGEKFFVVKRTLRSNHTDISLPKWHIEEWETDEEAALREVLEETWLVCQIVWRLWTVMYRNPEWLIESTYFAMRVKEKWTVDIFPDVQEVISGNYDEILNMLSYATDKWIFEKWAKILLWN